jgi:hypothetical protein
MNALKITEFYPWVDNAKASLLNQFTLCLDANSGSGEFAFVYLLLKLLREGKAIQLLACNHNRNHYASILRKNVSFVMTYCS